MHSTFETTWELLIYKRMNIVLHGQSEGISEAADVYSVSTVDSALC